MAYIAIICIMLERLAPVLLSITAYTHQRRHLPNCPSVAFSFSRFENSPPPTLFPPRVRYTCVGLQQEHDLQHIDTRVIALCNYLQRLPDSPSDRSNSGAACYHRYKSISLYTSRTDTTVHADYTINKRITNTGTCVLNRRCEF